MGLVRTTVRLANLARPDLDGIDVNALVDTGGLHLCIPRHVALQLGLSATSQREVRLADGQPQMVDYVGPLRVIKTPESPNMPLSVAKGLPTP
jgi:hypothetical protein